VKDLPGPKRLLPSRGAEEVRRMMLLVQENQMSGTVAVVPSYNERARKIFGGGGGGWGFGSGGGWGVFWGWILGGVFGGGVVWFSLSRSLGLILES